MEKNDIYDALISLATALNGMLELAHDQGLHLSPTAEVLRKQDGQSYIHIQFVTPEEIEDGDDTDWGAQDDADGKTPFYGEGYAR